MGTAEHAVLMRTEQHSKQNKQQAFSKRFQSYLGMSERLEADIQAFNNKLQAIAEEQKSLQERRAALDSMLESLKREEITLNEN